MRCFNCKGRLLVAGNGAAGDSRGPARPPTPTHSGGLSHRSRSSERRQAASAMACARGSPGAIGGGNVQREALREGGRSRRWWSADVARAVLRGCCRAGAPTPRGTGCAGCREAVVVVAGDDNKLAIGINPGVQPDEQAMLGDARRRDCSGSSLEGAWRAFEDAGSRAATKGRP